MKSFKFGDILIVDYPFSSQAETKRRPSLVVIDSGDEDILLARITSQPAQSAFDISIAEWKQAGLRLPSTIRLHKLGTFLKGDVVRELSALTDADLSRVRAAMLKFWQSA